MATQTESELKMAQLLVEALNLEDMEAEEIDPEDQLFGDGLGLDSIDALELGLAVKNRYGVVLSAENEEVRQHFYSVATLTSFIQSQRA